MPVIRLLTGSLVGPLKFQLFPLRQSWRRSFHEYLPSLRALSKWAVAQGVGQCLGLVNYGQPKWVRLVTRNL